LRPVGNTDGGKMSDHSQDQFALQRHIYKNFKYTAYWRDRSIQTADIEDLCIDIEFPAHLRIPAHPTDFQYLPYAKRSIQFGVNEKRLPPYVFMKNLEPYFSIQKGFFSNLFGETDTNPNYKYGPNDLNLLLGSPRPNTLIELAKSFGFQLQSSATEIINAISANKYFAVVDDLNTYSSDVEDIMEMIFLAGIDLVEDFAVNSAKIQSVPPEKRRVMIDNEQVILPPFICQCKVSNESFLLTNKTQNPTKFLVLGAQNLQDLSELSSACNIQVENETHTDNHAVGRTRIPDDVQIFVWRRDQGRCVKCGSQERLEFDHIIPVSKGGSNSARNIQLLCQSCNRTKLDKIGG